MANKFTAGNTFEDGDVVTAANLNSHVTGAAPTSAFITDQTGVSNGKVEDGDKILITDANNADALRWVKVEDLFACPRPIGSGGNYTATPVAGTFTTLFTSGDVTVGDDVAVAGDAAVVGALDVDGATTMDAVTVDETLTVTGAATFNGAVTLGNAAADAITLSGTLAGTPTTTDKATPVEADLVLIQDSAASNAVKSADITSIVAASPQTIKAWVVGTNSGADSTLKFNVASVNFTDGTGKATITFSSNLASANYLTFCFARNSSHQLLTGEIQAGAAVGSCKVWFYNNSGALTTPDYFQILVFGLNA